MTKDIINQLNSLSNKMSEQIDDDKFEDDIPFGEPDKDHVIKYLRKNANDNYAELQLIIKKFVKDN